MPNLIDTVCSQLYTHLKFREGISPSNIKPYPGDVANKASQIVFIHELLKESGFFDFEVSPFGFHLNEAGQRDDRKIVFGSATTGTDGTGPATSIHMFYSVNEAKTLVRQLLIAIAQAEAVSKND
jgi:hypothetical protein